ncbi:NHL repeat-containing protein [Cytophaga aurantiaca]|uniref:NHL repeat-containing protein n=1 Tax=Cytophaga aurantiaca TaxID=29530 RepID=UPI0003605F9D|nr:NHL repeat-containing protein [Cytophaga aurantiaca]
MKHRNFSIAVLFILLLSACHKKANEVAPPIIPPGDPQNVTTFAGSGTAGSADGTGIAASFSGPRGLAMDGSGNIYVADFGNHLIRKITSAGVVSTFAGTGSAGFVDGTGTAASFNSPRGLAVDAFGNVFVADWGNHTIRKITPAGVVTKYAGTGSYGSVNAKGTSASFNSPAAVAFDRDGNLYVADTGNDLIRKISPARVVTTLAGSGSSGNSNGNGTAATFNEPFGITVQSSGNIIVADRSNHLIRKITPAGIVTTLAGSGTIGSADGVGTAASFYNPYCITADSYGNLYVTDWANNLIRRITDAGKVTTLAGGSSQNAADGKGANASFNFPTGIVVDSQGNLYVSDSNNNTIRKISY